MENNQSIYHVNPAIVTAVILQFVFIIFASIAIYSILNRNVGTPKIKISNYSTISDGEVIGGDNTASNTQDIKFTLDDTAKNTIESAIYDIASNNNKNGLANNGAKIREGTSHYVYIENLNAYLLNFIVDIEDLGQSYRFVWLFDNNLLDQNSPKVSSLMVFCPKESEIIYDDFNCKDDYDGHGLDIIVYNLLRYKMFSNFTVGLSNVYNGEPLTLDINVNSDSEATKDAAVQEISNYLSSLGFGLDDFKYTIRYLEVAK